MPISTTAGGGPAAPSSSTRRSAPRIPPAKTPRALASQYFRYGQGKTEMLWANGRFPSWRPLAPLLLVLGIVIGLVILITTGLAWPLLLLLGAWLIVIGIVAMRAKASWWRVFAAAGIMHLTYGWGLLWGLVRGPRPVRQMKPTDRVVGSVGGVIPVDPGRLITRIGTHSDASSASSGYHADTGSARRREPRTESVAGTGRRSPSPRSATAETLGCGSPLIRS